MQLSDRARLKTADASDAALASSLFGRRWTQDAVASCGCSNASVASAVGPKIARPLAIPIIRYSAAVLHRFDAIRDLDQLAGRCLRIGERAVGDELHACSKLPQGARTLVVNVLSFSQVTDRCHDRLQLFSD